MIMSQLRIKKLPRLFMIKTKVKLGDTFKNREDGKLCKLISIGTVFHLINTDLQVFQYPLESFKLRLEYDKVEDDLYLDYVNRKYQRNCI